MAIHNTKYDDYKSPRSFQDNKEQDVIYNSEDGHSPNKYFEGDATLNEVEKLTEKKIFSMEEIDEHDVENLCYGSLTNKLYCRMQPKKRRKRAIGFAAHIILTKGKEIQSQINKNDALIEQSKTTAQSIPPQNGKSDIPRISGGTLSEVITKMTEMLAGKSGVSLKSGADNFAAMIEVLSSQEVVNKFADTMKIIAKDPILVADIKDVLKETSAGPIFSGAIDKYCNKIEKQAVSLVSSEDLSARRAENMLSNKKNMELMMNFVGL